VSLRGSKNTGMSKEEAETQALGGDANAMALLADIGSRWARGAMGIGGKGTPEESQGGFFFAKIAIERLPIWPK